MVKWHAGSPTIGRIRQQSVGREKSKDNYTEAIKKLLPSPKQDLLVKWVIMIDYAASGGIDQLLQVLGL